jgi:ribosome modulation factor
MLDIQQIRDHAIKAANEEKSKEACPFDETSVQARMWLDYFYAQVRWLSGEDSA